MSPQSNDVVDVGRAASVQIDLIAPYHPLLELCVLSISQRPE
jgi:hypothetical protein